MSPSPRGLQRCKARSVTSWPPDTNSLSVTNKAIFISHVHQHHQYKVPQSPRGYKPRSTELTPVTSSSSDTQSLSVTNKAIFISHVHHHHQYNVSPKSKGPKRLPSTGPAPVTPWSPDTHGNVTACRCQHPILVGNLKPHHNEGEYRTHKMPRIILCF